MIDYIFQDAVYFLGLAFIVLCGFALALGFLLRHAASDYPRLSVTNSRINSTTSESATEQEEKAQDVQDAFGDIFKSLETLFFALLGEFDRDVSLSSLLVAFRVKTVIQVYRADDDLGWLIVGAFILYLITLVILLLNLLISTMGDTFDRVKRNEDDLLLMNRAKFINSCEAALSESERQKIA